MQQSLHSAVITSNIRAVSPCSISSILHLLCSQQKISLSLLVVSKWQIDGHFSYPIKRKVWGVKDPPLSAIQYCSLSSQPYMYMYGAACIHPHVYVCVCGQIWRVCKWYIGKQIKCLLSVWKQGACGMWTSHDRHSVGPVHTYIHTCTQPRSQVLFPCSFSVVILKSLGSLGTRLVHTCTCVFLCLHRVLPTLVGFGIYQPPLTPKLPPLKPIYQYETIKISCNTHNFGDTGAIFTTSKIFWGEPCLHVPTCRRTCMYECAYNVMYIGRWINAGSKQQELRGRVTLIQTSM